MPRKNNLMEPEQEITLEENPALSETEDQAALSLAPDEPEFSPDSVDAPQETDCATNNPDLTDLGLGDQDIPGSLPLEDATEYGDLPVPLDVEQRIDEELVALEQELEGDQTGQDEPAEPVKPKKKAATRRKKAAGDACEDTVENAAGDTAKEEPDTAAEEYSADAEQQEVDATSDVEYNPDAGQQEAASTQLAKRPQTTAVARPASARAQAASSFFQTKFNRLDRNLSEEEQQEWNAIYASFRSRSILTGVVAGVDENELPVRGENGQVEMRIIHSLVVIAYRVKVLIPETAVWMRGEERSAFLLRGMVGATVDYVITNVDREGEVALASRSLALVKRRRAFISSEREGQPGDLVPCSVLIVGARRCLLQCGGYDVPMRQPDMSWSSILDMRELYRPGQELKARILEHKPAENKLRLSVKEATPHPFDGADRRHPVGSRRQAVITGKYAGGVFCTLQDGTLCLCLYSNSHYDSDFLLGDNVIVHIAQFNYRQKHIYGRIVSKW